MKSSAFWIVVSFLGLVVSACSSSSDKTVGDQCGSVMNAFCSRARTCGLKVSDADCNQGTNTCCGGHCGDTAQSSDSSIDTCVKAMDSIACSDFSSKPAESLLPSSCRGVVKHNSASVVPHEIEVESHP